MASGQCTYNPASMRLTTQYLHSKQARILRSMNTQHTNHTPLLSYAQTLSIYLSGGRRPSVPHTCSIRPWAFQACSIYAATHTYNHETFPITSRTPPYLCSTYTYIPSLYISERGPPTPKVHTHISTRGEDPSILPEIESP